MAHQHGGKGRLAGAVGAHESVDLAGSDSEIDTVEDLHCAGRGVKVFDLEEGRGVAHCVDGIYTIAVGEKGCVPLIR